MLIHTKFLLSRYIMVHLQTLQVNPAQRKKLRGKNKCFIFAVNKFYDYET